MHEVVSKILRRGGLQIDRPVLRVGACAGENRLGLLNHIGMLRGDVVLFCFVAGQIVQLKRRPGFRANGFPVAKAHRLTEAALGGTPSTDTRGSLARPAAFSPSKAGTIEMPSSPSGARAPASSARVGNTSHRAQTWELTVPAAIWPG